ncbi:MAG: hypothetical protein ACI8S3_001567, partial [Alphaproteobacteria bacterium]
DLSPLPKRPFAVLRRSRTGPEGDGKVKGRGRLPGKRPLFSNSRMVGLAG